MPIPQRSVLCGLVGLACALASPPARAWIETTVLSDAVSVELDGSGQAIVSHELWLKLRGGPLKGTELDGVDADAEPLPDAVVARISGGNSRSADTKPLLLSRGEDDTLRIEVQDGALLRAGTYAFRFKYRTDLRQRSRIQLRGSWAEIGWIGPRYRAGLDVAKVTFKLPYASTAPRLPEIEPGADELLLGELPNAAMVSTTRRGAEQDELELVRPHIAKGEPVLWRIWAAPATFPWLAEPKRAEINALTRIGQSPRAPLGQGIPLVLATLMATMVAILVLAKARVVATLSAQQGCAVSPMVALGAYPRAILSGLLLGAALLLSVRFDATTSAAIALLLGLSCMGFRRASMPRVVRGPGRWLPIHQDEAFRREGGSRIGRFLDASTWAGRSVLGLWTLAVLAAVSGMFKTQPYLASLVLMAVVIPWPVMLTGCAAEFPSGAQMRARRELAKLYARLKRLDGCRVHPIARFGECDHGSDELRLKISAFPTDSGVVGLEIAMNTMSHLGQPCLLIRVREGSDAHWRFAQTWPLVRGRAATERVIVFAPTIAPRTRILSAIGSILQGAMPVRDHGPVSPSSTPPASKARRSSGNGSVTSKPSKSSVPPQATRAA